MIREVEWTDGHGDPGRPEPSEAIAAGMARRPGRGGSSQSQRLRLDGSGSGPAQLSGATCPLRARTCSGMGPH